MSSEPTPANNPSEAYIRETIRALLEDIAARKKVLDANTVQANTEDALRRKLMSFRVGSVINLGDGKGIRIISGYGSFENVEIF